MKLHYIYFFQDEKLHVKIGRTADPERIVDGLAQPQIKRLTDEEK